MTEVLFNDGISRLNLGGGINEKHLPITTTELPSSEAFSPPTAPVKLDAKGFPRFH